MDILIVGGKGKMGSFFVSLFEKQRILFFKKQNTVRIIDLDNRLELDLLDIKNYDVVLLCVPHANIIDVIKEYMPFVREDAVICDINSIKMSVCSAYTEISNKDPNYKKLGIISLHPLFGPDVNLKNQKILSCPVQSNKNTKKLINCLKSIGFIIEEISPFDHDRYMSIIQGLNHFLNVSFGVFLEKNNISIDILEKLSSPIYKLDLQVLGRIFKQEPFIYSDIFIHNEFTKQIVDNYLEVTNDLLNRVKLKQAQEIDKKFLTVRKYFGNKCEKYDNLIRNILNQIARNHD